MIDHLLSDGVYWFITSIDISDLSKDYILQVEKGIDDSDQTYFNGKLIGNTYGWNLERKYTIPKNILKKGRNIIAIRVTDTGGEGGFNSPIKLYNENGQINVPFESFKYKHHGFISNGSNIIVHNYNNDELYKIDEQKRKDISKITPFNSPNGFSALYGHSLTARVYQLLHFLVCKFTLLYLFDRKPKYSLRLITFYWIKSYRWKFFLVRRIWVVLSL